MIDRYTTGLKRNAMTTGIMDKSNCCLQNGMQVVFELLLVNCDTGSLALVLLGDMHFRRIAEPY